MKIFIPEKLIELAERLKKYGTLYIVGGYVRNAILGFSDTDIDLAAGITPEKIVEVLKDSDFEIIEKSYKLGTVTIKCETKFGSIPLLEKIIMLLVAITALKVLIS